MTTATASATHSRMRPPEILFLGSGYAGQLTRFLNLRTHTCGDSRIRPIYRAVTAWKNEGIIERLPLLANRHKARMRAIAQAGAVARFPRPDAIWTVVAGIAAPYFWTQLGPLRRPVVLDTDCTLDQIEAMAPLYFGRPPHGELIRNLIRFRDHAFVRSVSLFTPWSTWAADGLRREGVPDDRIFVLPPGVDLDFWHPADQRKELDRPLRLLFVGADFVRKGGPALVDLIRTRFARRCELDVVTHSDVAQSPGIRVHQAAPNSPELRALFQEADLFVLPSRAECFGLASVEALASGLPVIMTNVGAARDIVQPGTGWLVDPTTHSLASALDEALALRNHLPQMSRNARRWAEKRFDGKRNDGVILEIMLEQAARFRAGACAETKADRSW